MKRVFLTIFCAIFALGLFAQKVMIVHKTDGSKIEMPIESVKGFDFLGKAQVNDGDYTQISNMKLHSGVNLDIVFDVDFHAEDPYISAVKVPVYGEDWGILFSTSPNVTVENATLMRLLVADDLAYSMNLANTSLKNILIGETPRLEGLKSWASVDLEYETTYYFRTYVRRPGNDESDVTYFYSTEQSVYTDKPTMAYYGVEVDPALYASGYVMPTDEAWKSFVERFPEFNVAQELYKPSLMIMWNEYLTAERVASLKAQCSTVYGCCDGMLYMLDAIGDDFGQYVLDYCIQPQVMTGYAAEEDVKTAEAVYVACDESWGVPGNGYWEYRNVTATGNPRVIIRFEKPLLANQYYTIEVTFAPDTEKVDTLPSKCNVQLYYTATTGKTVTKALVKNFVTNKPSEATVFSVTTPVIEGFGEAYIEITGKVGSKEGKEFSRILRIAQVKVTYLPAEEED